MDELRGRMRPVHQTVDGAIEPAGNGGDVVRYRVHQLDGIVEVLDSARIPYEEGATGFGLFDHDGQLLTSWELFAAPGHNDLCLPAGWGFQSRRLVDVTGGRALHGATGH